MALVKTGFTDKTVKSYLINAGTIFTNVKHTALDGFTGEAHGATAGGVKVVISQEYRDIEVDGANHVKVKGNKVLSKAEATITANMKEVTAETIRRSINGLIREADAEEAPTGYRVVESKRYLEDTDYIDNVAIVGTLSGTDEPVIFILDNALCTSGLDTSMEDESEAVIEQVYEAHASIEQLNADEMPWRIFYPNVVTV